MNGCPGGTGRLTVDLDAVRANFAALAAHVAPAACAAVIKADAYGLGAPFVAEALHRQGCRSFFVAHLSEALAIARVLEPDSDIFVLNGLEPGYEPLCADRGFIPVLNAPEQVEAWRGLAIERGRALPAALQIDTGMSRLGMDLDCAVRLANDATLAEQLSLRLLMTHLACADLPDHPANADQLARFAAVRSLFPAVPASIANSAGAVLGGGYHFDLVRAGLALFGTVSTGTTASPLPAVRLDARIIQIRTIEPGDGVGYGLAHIASTPQRLATLGIGYADGWPRSLSGRGAAWFKGVRLPIVGRVSMDCMTVDISALPEGALGHGDFVELIGPSQSAVDVADDAGTIDHEILARLGTRFQRLFIESGVTDIQSPGGL
ncbi:alanine racemase [Sphingomonas colocasiae]|uniref:Alanine racemase n=1 Tax=Sphingomonas colocasiae TaxID=1848973 RepID=A0ABS7PND3_9SPHN|nr:alanine racemase [Sphingomonas colocasiae]MBY8822818.1 alanine racemase [Sphingomonas colocasiae]